MLSFVSLSQFDNKLQNKLTIEKCSSIFKSCRTIIHKYSFVSLYGLQNSKLHILKIEITDFLSF